MIRNRVRLAEIERIKLEILEEIRYDMRPPADEPSAPAMTRAALAKVTGLTQSETSELCAGKLRRFTVDRMLMVLIALGHKPKVSVC